MNTSTPCKVLGFSGGQDSCALAHYLKYEKGITDLVLIHFDHKWPEDKGLTDKCKQLANQIGLELIVLEGDSSNNEQEARHARYRAISEYTKDVYIAHTLTDKVETGIYNLCRNPSMKGITSLNHDKRYLEDYNLTIYRPFLDWTREDTQRYCELVGLSYHTDAYNHKEDVSKRVIIRNRVMKELSKVNVASERHISEFIDEVKEVNTFITNYVNKVWDKVYEPTQNSLIKELLLQEDRLIQNHIWIKYLTICKVSLKRKTINYLVDWSNSELKTNSKTNNLTNNTYIKLSLTGLFTFTK